MDRPLEETPALWSALVPAVNTGRLARDLDTLSTGLGTRHSYTPEMVLATQYVYDTFAGLGLEASFDPFTYNGRSLRNVLGIKPGLTEPDRIVVVVGHLDSTSPDPANSAPGADDNASGAIAVLEAARLLAPLPTARTIYFLAVSAEEQGLIGSAHFAAAAAAAGLGIEAVLNLDMVGYHEPEGADLWLEGFHYGVSSAWLMELLGENAETYAGLAIYLYPGEGFGSDHVPFHNHGFPAILSIENEWDDFPCYHQTCDTAEWVNPWLWRGITAANAITAAQLAGLEAGTGAVEGTVLVPEGLDASGVTLRLEGTGYPGRQTGLSGAFAWEAVFPGRYLLRAERTGCLPVEMEIEVPSGESVPVEVVLPRDPAAGPDGDVAAAPAVRLTVAPNPTPRGAAIHLNLAQPATGRLEIFAADGRRMATLVAGELPAGAHRLLWDGRDTAGRRAAAGTYWVRWSASNGDIVRRVIRAG